MAWFDPPELLAGCVEGFGTAPAYAIDVAATPRRIWELRGQSLAARSAALALPGSRFRFALAVAVASVRWERAAVRGPWAAVRWGRQGRAADIAMEGDAFSRGQEPARKARPHLTHSQGRMPGERRPGVAFLFGDFLFGHAKRKSLGRRQAVETALFLAEGGRNRRLWQQADETAQPLAQATQESLTACAPTAPAQTTARRASTPSPARSAG